MAVTCSAQIADYYEGITGERLEVLPVRPGAIGSLPLYLRQLYRFHDAKLFGRSCLLAELSSGDAPPSPAEYAAHIKTFQERTGREVVLILPDLPSYERNRLVRAMVPFLVPGRQMFLPMLRVDLRERFAAPRRAAGPVFTAAAQAFIIYRLNRIPALADAPLRVIAHELDYSPMTITKVKRELESADLSTPGRDGHATPIQMKLAGRALWDAVKFRLSSPVRKTCWSVGTEENETHLRAGLTALSEITDLGDDPVPTYACYRPQWRENSARNDLIVDRTEADVRVEWWKYNPWKLTQTGHAVDPFSLYLSLRDSPDERVQQALEILVEKFPWKP